MNNFTLIIPTHNRHNYLKRSISYFKNLDATVIYCDSSKKKYEGSLSTNMHYIHLPNKKFAAKVLDALQVVKTPFVSLCADDDFILIDSLSKGISILEDNKDYKTIVGKYISFKESFDDTFYPMYQNLPSDTNLGFNKNAESFFKNYYKILWAMYYKKILLKAFNIINEANFKNDNFIEIVIGACACYDGGIRFLDEIWGVREISTQEHWGMRHKPLNSVANLHEDSDYQSFKNLLEEKTSKGYADLVLNSYLNKQFVKKNFIKKVIPNSVKQQIVKFRNLFSQKKKPLLITSKNEEKSLNKLSLILKNK